MPKAHDHIFPQQKRYYVVESPNHTQINAAYDGYQLGLCIVAALYTAVICAIIWDEQYNPIVMVAVVWVCMMVVMHFIAKITGHDHSFMLGGAKHTYEWSTDYQIVEKSTKP